MAATFPGCFFAAHCVISITRNRLFVTRVAGGRITELSIRTSALGAVECRAGMRRLRGRVSEAEALRGGDDFPPVRGGKTCR